MRHRSRVGGLLAQQEPHERRLTRAVGADDGEAVAALHDEVEASDDGPVVGLRQAARDDDAFARGGPGVERQRGGADAPDLVAPLGPQVLERPHAAHVALAPRADPLDRPLALGADQAVELVAGHVLLVPGAVAPSLEVPKAAVVAADGAAVHPQRRAGRGAQHGAVVADEDEGARHLGEAGL